MNNVTLIIPAKLESESLPSVLSELANYKYNINVVLHREDISTIEAIKKFDIKIIYQKNHGYGDALIQGIIECETEYFCIFNADGSFNPSEIFDMFESLKNRNLDFIFGSRYQINSGTDDDTFITSIGNFIFTKIGNIFFKLPITDILYTYVIGKTVNANILRLKQKDFSFCVELPIKAIIAKMNLGSFSSYERRRIAGKKKVNAFKDGWIILTYMIRIFFSKSLKK